MTIPNGVIVKLNRAREHAAAAQRAVEAFIQTEPYAVGRALEDNGATHVYRFTRYGDTPPEVALPIGDAVRNMRSSLDHLTFALALKGAASMGAVLSDEDGKWIQYPVTSSLNKFNRDVGKRLRFVSTDAIDDIRRLQPFTIPDPQHHPLTCMSALNNTDKHRQLTTVASRVRIVDIEVPPGTPQPERDLRSDGTWGLGSKVVTFHLPDPQPHIDLNFRPTFSAEIEDSWPPRPVDEALAHFLSHIESILLPTLARHFD